jgi:hypothetical protein
VAQALLCTASRASQSAGHQSSDGYLLPRTTPCCEKSSSSNRAFDEVHDQVEEAALLQLAVAPHDRAERRARLDKVRPHTGHASHTPWLTSNKSAGICTCATSCRDKRVFLEHAQGSFELIGRCAGGRRARTCIILAGPASQCARRVPSTR